MAVRDQTVQELTTKVAERWRSKKPYDRTTLPSMIREAIRGRGITDKRDVGELLQRVAAECAMRSASHRKAVAASRKIAS
ncbi:MAG: hypothetical protein KBD06_02745 [Candidatus Pacebacteria bacterium]|nr:hypothetical protein [Candidatus Paceibacterota bacterium]